MPLIVREKQHTDNPCCACDISTGRDILLPARAGLLKKSAIIYTYIPRPAASPRTETLLYCLSFHNSHPCHFICRSFTGLLVVINKRVANSIGLSHAFIFASGALLTASLLHIVPEAMEGLESKYDSLHDLGLYAGLTVLAGITFGMVIHALLESGHSHSQDAPHHNAVGAIGAGSSSGAAVSPEAGLMPAVTGSKVPSTQDVTQPMPLADMSHDNLRGLIAARQDRSLLDIKGLQPVCWNVIAGDLVRLSFVGVRIGFGRFSDHLLGAYMHRCVCIREKRAESSSMLPIACLEYFTSGTAYLKLESFRDTTASCRCTTLPTELPSGRPFSAAA